MNDEGEPGTTILHFARIYTWFYKSGRAIGNYAGMRFPQKRTARRSTSLTLRAFNDLPVVVTCTHSAKFELVPTLFLRIHTLITC